MSATKTNSCFVRQICKIYHWSIWTKTHHLSPWHQQNMEIGWCIFNIDWVVACTMYLLVHHQKIWQAWVQSPRPKKKSQNWNVSKILRVWVIESGPVGKPESLPVHRRSTNSINQIPNSEFLGLVPAPVNASVFPFAINKNLKKIPNVFVRF